MEAVQPSISVAPRRRLLSVGENVVGTSGIALCATVLLTLAFGNFWSLRDQAAQQRQETMRNAAAVASTLADTTSSLLARNDIVAVRRLMVQTRKNSGLARCTISLTDGQIIADGEPSKITTSSTLDAWPSAPLEPADADIVSDVNYSVHLPLRVPGKGAAMLCVTAPFPESRSILRQTISGSGLIGAAGLLVSWLIYRHMRSRVQTLGMIREALLSINNGAVCRDALGLADSFGQEAAAWNRLLEENQTLQDKASAERVNTSLGDRREGRGDLEHACDALSIGMIVIDDKREIKLINGASAVLLAGKREAMIGQPITCFIDEPDMAAALQSIGGASPQRRSFELKRKHVHGTGTLRISIRPLRREDVGSALITIEDVTQQRLADEARNNFVSQAAHELRTPLTNMRLCLEDALDAGQTDPEQLREHFNMLNTESRRLERIVGEMLSVSEIEAGSLQIKRDDVRLEKLIEELRTDFASQSASKKIAMDFQLPPKYPLMVGDRDKLMVVLHNLLGNAVKYTPEGGKVSVAVRADATTLTIDFTDTGIGIAEQEIPKLFAKFYRSKDERVAKIVGTGLGLALAREVARLHGGDISIQSELNKGSTFTLSLPLKAPMANAA